MYDLNPMIASGWKLFSFWHVSLYWGVFSFDFCFRLGNRDLWDTTFKAELPTPGYKEWFTPNSKVQIICVCLIPGSTTSAIVQCMINVTLPALGSTQCKSAEVNELQFSNISKIYLVLLISFLTLRFLKLNVKSCVINITFASTMTQGCYMYFCWSAWVIISFYWYVTIFLHG